VAQADNAWARGTRGWGSSAALISSGQACTFQQNPTDAIGTIITFAEVDEAFADMFLNWVYKSNGDNRAFQNEQWANVNNCTTNGITAPDAPNTGDNRFTWMNNTLQAIGDGRTPQW
jgi:hypothetical protein